MEQVSSEVGCKKQPISQILANLDKNELLKRDIFGRTILHLVILTNRYDLLRHLLKNPNLRSLISLTDYENGWNCLHYAIFYTRICCLRSLYESLQNSNTQSIGNWIPELLKVKDRNRRTPLQLLQNDFKDMVWYPEFITESDRVKLSYRYGEIESNEEKTKSGHSRKQKHVSHVWWDGFRGGSDLLMLGCNISNNLGVGDSNDRLSPTRIHPGYFQVTDQRNERHHTRFKQVKISKNHAVVVTTEGYAFSSGLSSRGRLGHGQGKSSNNFRFQLIEGLALTGSPEIDTKVKEVAISKNHSLALTNGNSLFAWGLNDFNQLGFNNNQASSRNKDSNESSESIPRSIVTGDIKKLNYPFLGLAVSNIHSVAFTKHEILSWGLNIGQMGLKIDGKDTIDFKSKYTSGKGEIQSYPRAISLRDEIKCLNTCDTCTCFATEYNDIHVYFNFQHIKLPKLQTRFNTEKDFDHFKPGNLTRPPNIIKIVMKSHKLIAILTDNGQVWGFTLNNEDPRNTKYFNIWRSYDEEMKVSDLDIGCDGSIVLCTKNGHVFYKSSQTIFRRNSFTESNVPVMKGANTKFKRIETLNRIVQVSCDEKFSSFSFIRDEIDMIPLQMVKNTFFEDTSYLGYTHSPNASRKQDELYESCDNFDSYIADFLYAKELKSQNVTNLFNNLSILDHSTKSEGGKDKILAHDKVLRNYRYRYDPRRHKAVSPEKTFSNPKKDFDASNALVGLSDCLSFPNLDEKRYDGIIKVKNYENFPVYFHRFLFEKRLPLCANMFNSVDDMFVDGVVLIKFDNVEKCIFFDYDVCIESVLLFVQSVYNSFDYDINNSNKDYSSEESKKIKSEYLNLVRIFRGANEPHRQESLSKAVESLIDDQNGDVEIILLDGSLKCHSSILIARSAYFETIFSSRWNRSKQTLKLDNVTKEQFIVVLKYIYGSENQELFNSISSTDNDEFVMFLMDMIVIADELLLVDLSALCQLAVKDFISTDNVLELAIQSCYISASKLFLNCCWLIYNNLEVFLFDRSLNELPIEVLGKVEEQMRFFNRCKHIDMVDVDGTICEGYTKNWAERKSNFLISKFLFSLSEYNENFISDRKGCSAFAPLIDSKNPVRGDNEGSSKKDPCRSRSSAASRNELLKFRQNIGLQNHASDEDAVDDSMKDFETIEYRRRKSKNVNSQQSELPSHGAVRNFSPNNEAERKENQNAAQPNGNMILAENHSSQPFNAFEFEKSYQWGSRRKSSLSASQQPVLGESSNDADARRKGKKLIAPIRISQKERKKMASSNNESYEEFPKDAMPWSVPASSSSSLSSVTSELPVLGATQASQSSTAKRKTSKSDIKINKNEAEALGLSSEDIMIQESLMNEMSRQKESDKTSLAEIQQEQEFAKWWEQETARIQKQLGRKTPKERDSSKKMDKRNRKKPTKPMGSRNHSPQDIFNQ